MSLFRYESCDTITNVKRIMSDGSERRINRLSTVFYPDFRNNEDVFVVSQLGDRLDNIAFDYYGNSSYWYVLAVVNNLGKGTVVVPPGIVLRIPYYDGSTGIAALFEQYNFMR